MIKNKGLRSGRIKREDIAMKNEKISRRSFLKASAVASALGVMAAAKSPPPPLPLPTRLPLRLRKRTAC